MTRSIASSTLLIAAGALAAASAGCRGQVSRKPPIHLNPNMDNQERFDSQEPNPFFSDHRAMRPEVPGTVAVGSLKDDPHLYRGELDGRPADTLPVPVDHTLLRRGRERYGIYCTPCHDGSGTGDGIIVRNGMLPPPSLHEPRLRSMRAGQIFQTISLGVRNMPPYAAQIPAKDRWAIVAYVRALQLSRDAAIDQVPQDIAAAKGWKP